MGQCDKDTGLIAVPAGNPGPRPYDADAVRRFFHALVAVDCVKAMLMRFLESIYRAAALSGWNRSALEAPTTGNGVV